ncbi:hypothetical protein H2200_006513 [Cladophialophora chaetospira]|uniref:Cyclase n=1 Tax=Cladophialophora chaetospira TaxID=386627 RepID=A0AA39CHA5_9EURO|nr:hypothetical protein H2200_006513 [Cladophialophora chaetospira]
MAKLTQKWPDFDTLPLDKSGPPGNAWGLFGKDDQLGRLNLITPETVKEVVQEVKEGTRVSLDWQIDRPSFPAFGRPRFQQQLINYAPRAINDEILTFNTQCSTQWDGFRHYAYQNTQQFYNGYTQKDIEAGGSLGINLWAEAGGITARGVLVDYYGYRQRKGDSVDPFLSAPIKLEEVLEILEDEKVGVRPADVLFIRTGFVAEYKKFSAERQAKFAGHEAGYLGFEATKPSLKWLWDSKFAAVASDSPSFERSPLAGSYNEPNVSVHTWGLAGWGMPIGELFDLDALAEECLRLKCWTFFVSSVPLKVPGGVASPPSAVAIF